MVHGSLATSSVIVLCVMWAQMFEDKCLNWLTGLSSFPPFFPHTLIVIFQLDRFRFYSIITKVPPLLRLACRLGRREHLLFFCSWGNHFLPTSPHLAFLSEYVAHRWDRVTGCWVSMRKGQKTKGSHLEIQFFPSLKGWWIFEVIKNSLNYMVLCLLSCFFQF